MTKTLSQFRLRKPIFINPRLSVLTAAKTMTDENVGFLMISVDKKTCEGVISERDIVRGSARHGVEFYDRKTGDVSMHKPITCSINKSISDALKIMERHKIRHLPIESKNAIVGVIGIRDVLHAITNNFKFEFFD